MTAYDYNNLLEVFKDVPGLISGPEISLTANFLYRVYLRLPSQLRIVGAWLGFSKIPSGGQSFAVTEDGLSWRSHLGHLPQYIFWQDLTNKGPVKPFFKGGLELPGGYTIVLDFPPLLVTGLITVINELITQPLTLNNLYLAYKGKVSGPFSLEDAKQAIETARMEGIIYVWQAPWPAWRIIDDIPQLAIVVKQLKTAK